MHFPLMRKTTWLVWKTVKWFGENYTFCKILVAGGQTCIFFSIIVEVPFVFRRDSNCYEKCIKLRQKRIHTPEMNFSKSIRANDYNGKYATNFKKEKIDVTVIIKIIILEKMKQQITKQECET